MRLLKKDLLTQSIKFVKFITPLKEQLRTFQVNLLVIFKQSRFKYIAAFYY